jgi:Uma2 family endonuclease
MEANRSRMRWTYDEYMRLPTSGSMRFEVIDGELAVTAAPSGQHQRMVTNLIVTLGPFVHKRRLGTLLVGPIDVLFAAGDYLQPDVVFVKADREHLVSSRGIEGPPDLVVEILSPSTAHRDRGIKLARYRHFGVPDYWIVDLGAGAIERWRLGEEAQSPEVTRAGDHLRWTPVVGGPTLEIPIVEVVPRGD